MFLKAFLATGIISLLSLSGVFLLGIKRGKLEKALFFLISFSAGSLMGGAFFHLLPESLGEGRDINQVFSLTILGFVIFYVLERILRWHHCHEENCEIHKVLGYQNLLGDGLHNFLDGLIIISSFSLDDRLGYAVALSVALHEIPQEISDFGVLLYSGFSKAKAVFYNLFSASLALFGVIFGFLLIEKAEDLTKSLLPLAAGGFIYIAASDLVPELHKEKDLKKSLAAFSFFLLAVFMMFFLAD